MKKKVIACTAAAFVLVLGFFPFGSLIQTKAEEVIFTNFAPTKSLAYWKENYTPTSTIEVESGNTLSSDFEKPTELYYPSGEWGLEYFRNDGTFIDISGATKIKLEIYFSDPIVINNAWGGSFQFASGNLSDEYETLSWKVGYGNMRGFVAGWNTVTLNIADADEKESFDFDSIKRFKISAFAFFDDYTADTGYTVKIRNIVAIKDVNITPPEGQLVPTHTLESWNINHKGTFTAYDNIIKGEFVHPSQSSEWVFDYHKGSAPVNISYADRITLDIYLSDPVAINGCETSVVQLKSGTIGATEYCKWFLGKSGKNDFVEGWNTVTLYFEDAEIGSGFSLSNVNTFKMVGLNFTDEYTAEGGYTIQIRNVVAMQPEPIDLSNYVEQIIAPTNESGYWITDKEGGEFSIFENSFKGEFVKPTGRWYGQAYGYGEWVLEYFRSDGTYVDLTNAEKIKFDIYVSDPVVINKGGEGHIMLRSGNILADEVCSWKIGETGKQDFVQGWNTVILDIDDATVGENFSLANVKVFKLHEMNFIDDYTSDSGYTIQLKNIAALIPKSLTTTTTTTTATTGTTADLSGYDSFGFAPTNELDYWRTDKEGGEYSIYENSFKGEFVKPTGPWYGQAYGYGEWILEYYRNDGTSIDLTNAEKIKFDIYISDPVVINKGGEGHVRLKSGGISDDDTESCIWDIGKSGKNDFVQGWNTVILDIDDATVGANFSLATVKVFKLNEMNFIDDYTSDSGYTIQIKNIEALMPKQTTTSTTVTTTTLSDITTTTLTDITDDTDIT
ncbi:MAG: hypothetical protein PHR18_07445, partial [Oscillospiraceae bacterium]|nr:hypothetical protein [Oscillospiraceae bacterium]